MILDMLRFPYLSGDSCKAYGILAWRASAFQHALTDEIAMEAVVPARYHPWPGGPPFGVHLTALLLTPDRVWQALHVAPAPQTA